MPTTHAGARLPAEHPSSDRANPVGMSDDAKEMVSAVVGAVFLCVWGYWFTVLMFCM